MNFSRNKREKFISGIKRYGDIPKLKPNQILIVPESDFMHDSDVFPYVNAVNRVEWVTKHVGDGSIRTCPGTTDLMQTGITIPLWADLRIRQGLNGMLEAEFNIGESFEHKRAGKIEPFDYEQTGSCPYTDKRDKSLEKAQYLKLVSPYMIKTARGYSSMITDVMVSPSVEFEVIPGIVNTDYYHTVNVVLNIKVNKEIYIPRGTPIAQIIVLKRNDNIKEMLVGDESVFELMRRRGFGGPWLPGAWRRGKYKKEQYAWDQD